MHATETHPTATTEQGHPNDTRVVESQGSARPPQNTTATVGHTQPVQTRPVAQPAPTNLRKPYPPPSVTHQEHH
jgi:hypothetical protein